MRGGSAHFHGTVGQRDRGNPDKKCLWTHLLSAERKLPAAGNHAEIRQAFICSTPACLEKYVINALKCSFIRVRLFFGLFYFDSFCLGMSSAGSKTHLGDIWKGSVLYGGLDGWTHSLLHFFFCGRENGAPWDMWGSGEACGSSLS